MPQLQGSSMKVNIVKPVKLYTFIFEGYDFSYFDKIYKPAEFDLFASVAESHPFAFWKDRLEGTGRHTEDRSHTENGRHMEDASHTENGRHMEDASHTEDASHDQKYNLITY